VSIKKAISEFINATFPTIDPSAVSYIEDRGHFSGLTKVSKTVHRS